MPCLYGRPSVPHPVGGPLRSLKDGWYHTSTATPASVLPIEPFTLRKLVNRNLCRCAKHSARQHPERLLEQDITNHHTSIYEDLTFTVSPPQFLTISACVSDFQCLTPHALGCGLMIRSARQPLDFCSETRMLRVSSVFIMVKEATMVKFGARGGSIVEMAQAFLALRETTFGSFRLQEIEVSGSRKGLSSLSSISWFDRPKSTAPVEAVHQHSYLKGWY